MKNIKFRVWKKSINSYLDDNVTVYNCICNSHLEDDLVWEQYIGIKDKNGKEIYEGDVLSHSVKIHEHGDVEQWVSCVKYVEEQASFQLFDMNDADNAEFDFCDTAIYNLEVVGNIYEGQKKEIV